MTLLIRASTETDIASVTAIYAHHVLHGTGSFEIAPPDEAEMQRRRQDVLTAGWPYLVAMADDRIVGYAYAKPIRPRLAYAHTLEDSIYVASDFAGRGAGRALLAELIARCMAKDARQMVAVIGDAANAGSIGLHTALGFQPAGRLSASGWKFGRWIDTVLMQRTLGSGALTPPGVSGNADRGLAE